MKERRRLLLCLVCFLAACAAFCAVVLQSYQRLGKMASTLSENPLPTVVIDPGHGGEDGGTASAAGLLEKDVNLAVSLRLRELLELSGFPVVMTREEDRSIGDPALGSVRERKSSDLHRRLELVESQRDCVLLSIHQNYFSESQYSGAQVFYSPNHPQSAELAEEIRKAVTAQLQPENTRECKAASESIFLLHQTTVPAVIVECGFLSNPQEAALLSEEEYQSQMAFSIYLGFLSFWGAQADG